MANTKYPVSPRTIVKMKFGTKNFYSRVKISTLKALGIQAESGIPKGKDGKHPIRGSLGAKHYTLKLAKTVDGKNTLSFPVSSDVPLIAAYAAFRKLPNVIGIISPNGVSYNWGARSSSKAIVNAAFIPIPTADQLSLIIDIARLFGVNSALISWAELGFKLLK